MLAAGLLFILVWLAFVVFFIICMWKIHEKAGQPGWACLVPIYNLYILTQIARKPGWWTVMFFLPIANIVFLIMTYIEIAKNFGKSSGFGVGLAFLGIVFIPILAFGDAKYLHTQPSANGSLDHGM